VADQTVTIGKDMVGLQGAGVGRSVESLAHDLNNIIAANLLHLVFLRQTPQMSGPAMDILTEMETEMRRAGELTRQLLNPDGGEICGGKILGLKSSIWRSC
jgi:hypothetical protein